MTGASPAEQVAAGSRVRLRPLSVRPEGDDFIVGDIACGEFIQVPAIAVTVIEALRDGLAVTEAAEIARSATGQDVDVADFLTTMIDLGFVASVDGVPVAAAGPELTDGGRAGAALARLSSPF